MKTITKQANNGLKLTVEVPETPSEFDTLAKREGACLDGGINDTLYRGVFPDFWDAMAAVLFAEHGVEHLMKDHPDGKKNDKGEVLQVRSESNPKYVNRVAASLGVEPTSFQSIADKICSEGWDETTTDSKGVTTTEHYELRFDPSVRERATKVPSIGKQDMADAAKFIAQGSDGLSVTLSKIAAVTGKTTDVTGLLGEPLQKAVALAIRDYRHTIAKQATQGLSS